MTSYGKHYTVDNARIYTLPDEPPPVYVSGFGPKATDLAARIGDGYISTQSDPELVTRFKEATGGKPAQAGAKVAYADTVDEGVAHAHRLWANSGLPGELAQVLPVAEALRAGLASWSPRRARASPWSRATTPRRTSQQIQEYADAGYDELYVANMGPHHQQMIEFYGREVLPQLS